MSVVRWWEDKGREKKVYGHCQEDDDDEKSWQDLKEATQPRFESKEEFAARLGRFKRFLASRPEHTMVLVGHCGYFRNLLNMWRYVGNCAIVEAHFDANTESVTHTAFVSFD